MKFASEDLKNEHIGILFGLQILAAQISQINRQLVVKPADLREMVSFFQTFADRCHHGKEEKIYFPNLIKRGVPGEGGLIGQLLGEHQSAREHVARMVAATAGDFDPQGFMSAASAYIKLLKAHIEQEDNVLFVLGDQLVPPEEQESLLAAFEEFEEQVMGAGTHQRLHQMLDRFEAQYMIVPDPEQ